VNAYNVSSGTISPVKRLLLCFCDVQSYTTWKLPVDHFWIAVGVYCVLLCEDWGRLWTLFTGIRRAGRPDCAQWRLSDIPIHCWLLRTIHAYGITSSHCATAFPSSTSERSLPYWWVQSISGLFHFAA